LPASPGAAGSSGADRVGASSVVALLKRFGRWFGLGRLVGLLLLAGFVGLRAWDPAPLETLRLKTFDLYQLVQPRTQTSNAVVVIDIDEKSLKALGQFPWARTQIAELVLRATTAGAAAIAFDVLFAEPDRLSPARFAEVVKAIDAETRGKLAAMPDNEVTLAAAFRRARVVLGRAGHHSPVDNPELKSLPRNAFGLVGGDPKPFLYQYPGLIHNLPELEKAALGRGLFTIRADRDGIIRRVPTVMVADGQIAPSLSMELLRVATNAPSLLVKRDEIGIKSVVVAGNEITTDRDGQLWVHFARMSPARFVSALDVIEGRVGPEKLRGKLALVGTSAVGLYDLRATPLDRVRPGVDIHAEVIDNILTRSLLVRPHYAVGAEIVLALAVGLVMVIFAPMVGAIPMFILGALIAAGLLGGSWYLFQAHRMLIDVVYPLASSLVVFGALTFTNYLREEAQRSQIRSAFQHYLSPDLVEQLSRDPDKLVLGGERRELSILFSDVRGFTSIAETFKADPAGLTNLMNRLLTPLSNAIIERRGTIDKYMGDAIMAFWNAPLDVADHPRQACEAALEMYERMVALNVTLEAEAKAAGRAFIPLRVGIGLATGMGIVGNMGSDLRFDYSVLGDSVNLASRIEGLTRFYDVSILLAEETAARGAGHLACLEIDRVQVKGKQDPERVFVLAGGPRLAADPDFQNFAKRFTEMVRLYRARDWAGAAAMRANLSSRANRYGLDAVLTMYAGRIAEYLITPPPAGWDGSFKMDTK
jgi:adenylate cyclase